ncbi:protein of unknown function DUF323 [Isosphaera pallida ATCC 43644]|uniref:Sulfatase-modifying factor enzyme-like domain-containing protein n=1 Tax=Isosphaera pallida (strain ATCC 43644 / DSM 9630 / IS1B) TaxID=575540 RepID=E8R1Z5_ISOPI|nr:SUMF1/EgtB/PvdO family nonheme iron enzyme [Isosphaera pallida]ADV62427.1 protein of unknown function DUF323 [Isosphaera pallida ATCC 43644]
MSSRSSLLTRIVNQVLGVGRNGHGARGRPAHPPRNDAELIDLLIRQNRYALVLRRDQADVIPHDATLEAWRVLEESMALIPGGVIPIVAQDGSNQLMEVPAFYLDRYAVTNAQYAIFVDEGCYEKLDLWPQEVWEALTTRFLDQSGQPGPAFWNRGRYPPGKENHPVVGVCWYEACAYAQWVGKRLPTAAEWQKASGFPDQLGRGGQGTRYPWGDIFAAGKANLAQAGIGETVPVNEFKAGTTRNGIYQLCGNVWEWLDEPLEMIHKHPDEQFLTLQPMRRIVGGAYDTYLIHEATNTFVTGQPELDRRPNIGFRCAVFLDQIRSQITD